MKVVVDVLYLLFMLNKKEKFIKNTFWAIDYTSCRVTGHLHFRRRFVTVNNVQLVPQSNRETYEFAGTYPVLCAYSWFWRKIYF